MNVTRSLLILLAACSSPPSHGMTGDASSSDGEPIDGAGSDAGVVITDAGPVRGTQEMGSWAWRGIPYAAPPIGGLRWRAPQLPASWSDIRDGSMAGNICPQAATPPATGMAGDEDCLYLNVWAPAPTNSPLPVIVFAHGGDWIAGAGSLPLYDGAYLAVHGPAIVVTINYRLGALGFLAHSALAAEDAHASTGNYGLLDQVAALGWVQRNAAAFGGDPTRVVFWGQSAGAWSALMHLASPVGRDLFARAMSESGGVYAQPLASAESNGSAYATALGCGTATDVLACLRALPTTSVAIAPPSSVWDPAIDGYVLTEPVATTFANGGQSKIPVIVGTTSVEYAGGLLHPPVALSAVTTVADYQSAIGQMFPVNASSVLTQYPAASYPTPRGAYVAVLDDWGMLCPARRTARALVASQTPPVWRYVYAHVDSSGPGATRFASHAVDLPLWFHTFDAVQGFVATAAELELSDNLVGYLARFAATGDPNLDGSPTWPQYDTTDPYVQLDDTITTGTGYHPLNCDFWDSLGTIDPI